MVNKLFSSYENVQHITLIVYDLEENAAICNVLTKSAIKLPAATKALKTNASRTVFTNVLIRIELYSRTNVPA